MKGKWRATFLCSLVIAIVAVLVWSGYLGYRWYEGYSLGKLIASEATSNAPSWNLPAWKEMSARRGQLEERLARLAPWQREIAFTTALNKWHGFSPSHVFGSAYLWNLSVRNHHRELMQRMMASSILELWNDQPDGKRLGASIEWLGRESGLPIYLAGPDRALDLDHEVLFAGRSFRTAMDDFAAACGLRWSLVEQMIVVGSDAEVAEFRNRAERRKQRIARCHYFVPKIGRMFSDQLTGPVTLEFFETPLSDVLDFLRDYLGVNIELHLQKNMPQPARSHFLDQPISVHVESFALGQALDCLLAPIGLDWEVVDGLMVFGTPSALVEFADRARRRHELIARSRESANPMTRKIAEKLGDLVTLEFVETPLRDVTDFISVYAGLDFLALGTQFTEDGRLGGPLREQPIVIKLEAATLGVALDCLADRNRFDWEVVDDFICLGNSDAIDRFRKRKAHSERELAEAPESLSKFLRRSLASVCGSVELRLTDGTMIIRAAPIEPGEYSCAEIVGRFAAMTAEVYQPVEVSGYCYRFSSPEITIFRAMDAICESTSLDWEPLENGLIRVF